MDRARSQGRCPVSPSIRLDQEHLLLASEGEKAYAAYIDTAIDDPTFASCEKRWADIRTQLAFVLMAEVRRVSSGGCS